MLPAAEAAHAACGLDKSTKLDAFVTATVGARYDDLLRLSDMELVRCFSARLLRQRVAEAAHDPADSDVSHERTYESGPSVQSRINARVS